MAVLVTGATGFVGRHLTNALAKQDEQVVVLCRENSLEKLGALPRNVQVFIQSGEPKVPELADILREGKVSQIFHAATLFTKKHESSQVADLVASNIGLGACLLEAAVVAEISNFVNFSSVWQLANHNEIGAQQTLYSATKEAFNEVLRFYAFSSDLRVTNFYLNDTYGASDIRLKLIPLLVAAFNDGSAMHIANPAASINLSFVNELVAKVVEISKANEEKFASYELLALESLQIREVVEIFREISGHDGNVTFGPDVEAEVPQHASNHSNIRRIYLETPFREGLRASGLLA